MNISLQPYGSGLPDAFDEERPCLKDCFYRQLVFNVSREVKYYNDRYSTIAAEILEGVTDRARFVKAYDLTLVPPEDPEISNADFDKTMVDFPPFPLDMDSDQPDAAEIQPWLEQVDLQFAEGLVMNEKPISANQRERIRSWLNQSFTEEKTEELLNQYVLDINSERYMIMGGLLNLFPPAIIDKTENAELQPQADGTYVYTLDIVASGTNDFKLMCTLVLENGLWKIGVYSYDMF
ncbi:IseA DL-endopeptidase inhibitor family protein [Paenibacillus sp. J2TS4]|uniref:IseA DL-endopeptidase inhibitor family protein n=1 Tax=Paenibacillus sp. J2TS4 TaxID=2807194 RepID=UPI001AFD4576|nr:IseA DL-endopeptidase inhibitor family protein [Paenibacillus sp. J2TS4]GIP34296.1 hypothetical protein J2TS4_35060 [Paenibacillus sp. J2TS4]